MPRNRNRCDNVDNWYGCVPVDFVVLIAVMKEKHEIRCIYQIRGKSATQGYGNCRKCIPDKLNEQCAGYTPVRWRFFEVKGT